MDRYEDDSYYDDSPFDDSSYRGASFEGDDIAVEPPASDDAIEHLWTAAHELLRAVRMIVDAADEFVSTQRAAMSGRLPREHAPEREPRVRRIDIDDRDDADDSGDPSSGSPGAPGATPR